MFFIVGVFQTEDIAVSDTTTSKHLDLEVETAEGFYFFDSNNDHFTMWLPGSYQIDKDHRFYTIFTSDDFSFFPFRSEKGDDPLSYSLTIRYWEAIELDLKQRVMETYENLSGENEAFSEAASNGKTVTTGKRRISTDGIIRDLPDNLYLAYIEDDDTEAFIEVTFVIRCAEDERCEMDQPETDYLFETIVEHVQFSASQR
ncbi:hypothetical protein JCM19045_815 [Bacillus sp. JCM 19045]|nr:hypothetical protein JCM19045_815 [Bacillus sp. JCM 19045]